MALAGVDPYIDDSKKKLLDAVAAAGTAGQKAYTDSQDQIKAYRQQVIDNAAKGLSGAPVAAALQAQSGSPFDRRLADSSAAQADFTGGLARMQAANDSYLTNVGAAQGTLQALNKNKLTDEEFRLKTIQAQLDAKAKQEADDRALKLQQDAETAQMAREKHVVDLANAQAEYAKNTATKPPTFDQIANNMPIDANATPATQQQTASQVKADLPITNDMLQAAQDNAAFNHTDPQVELRKIIAQNTGQSIVSINSILTPSKGNSFDKAVTAMSAPEKDTYADSITKKYSTKGVTPALAKSVVNNVDFQGDVNWILGGADGKTQDEVSALLRKYYLEDRNWPSEYNVLMGEYVSKLPTA